MTGTLQTMRTIAIVRTLFAALVVTSATALAEPITPVPEKIVCAVADRQDFQIPDRVHQTGWVGTRIAANESNRLVKLDPARLLEGYRKRPGRQAWDGEHVGKWLHAATLAWVYTGDPALRVKLDDTAAELCKCQLEDGYLGTYLEKDRWTEWDVWAHKYNLIGLITYMRYTGNMAPLPTCRRMADLLCQTFGDQPGQRDIIKAGHHVGMAPTSVLEPMVLLYRLTGEPRYLDFCKYILRAWEQPNGPHIVSTLLTVKRVDNVGNGKAYEMLSCLNGALEYYRTVGDQKILDACLNAWQDIVNNRLYLTGAASYGELFHDDFDLPNVANVGETCVTVTWLQFNAQLLRLTGEARFAEQLEHGILNQLFGAQKCDGSAWGYYVQMEGRKPYSDSLDGHCCLSSGPRGVALIPTFAVSTDADGVVMNLYDAGTARLKLRDGSQVSLVTTTRYPSDGRIQITVSPSAPKAFAVKVRIPA
ncbi:MAG: glycoside hydrolase family 127 protein, partial [Verrucomicrobiota bacterium]